MRKIAIVLALIACASLAACDPPQSAGQIAVSADAGLTRAETAYADAKAFAEIFLPILPADKVVLIRKAEAVVDVALAAARAAATIAERQAALKQAATATAQINAASSEIGVAQ